MKLEFRKISDYKRGMLYKLLSDAYSFDERYKMCFDKDWHDFDEFFFDNPDIADKYGFVTVLDGEAIGHISWDPRNQPSFVEIGHNCIVSKYKGNGYGKAQLNEAVRRITKYQGLEKITVCTNSKLVAPYNYESVGFKLVGRKNNDTVCAFSGDFLYYEIKLMGRWL